MSPGTMARMAFSIDSHREAKVWHWLASALGDITLWVELTTKLYHHASTDWTEHAHLLAHPRPKEPNIGAFLEAADRNWSGA